VRSSNAVFAFWPRGPVLRGSVLLVSFFVIRRDSVHLPRSTPELNTNTQEEYEDLAIELAMNPKKLADTKLKLGNNRLTTPLFNTLLFSKNLESACIKMVERYQADLQPEHIFIN